MQAGLFVSVVCRKKNARARVSPAKRAGELTGERGEKDDGPACSSRVCFALYEKRRKKRYGKKKKIEDVTGKRGSTQHSLLVLSSAIKCYQVYCIEKKRAQQCGDGEFLYCQEKAIKRRTKERKAKEENQTHDSTRMEEMEKKTNIKNVTSTSASDHAWQNDGIDA